MPGGGGREVPGGGVLVERDDVHHRRQQQQSSGHGLHPAQPATTYGVGLALGLSAGAAVRRGPTCGSAAIEEVLSWHLEPIQRPIYRPPAHLCCTSVSPLARPARGCPEQPAAADDPDRGGVEGAGHPARGGRSSPAGGPRRAAPRPRPDESVLCVARGPRPASADLTMALRDLYLARPALGAADRRTANRLLSRATPAARAAAPSAGGVAAAVLGRALLRALRQPDHDHLGQHDAVDRAGARVGA